MRRRATARPDPHRHRGGAAPRRATPTWSPSSIWTRSCSRRATGRPRRRSACSCWPTGCSAGATAAAVWWCRPGRPEHEVIQAALRADPRLVSVVEAGRRRLLRFPPAATMVVVGQAGRRGLRRAGRHAARGRASRVPMTAGGCCAARTATCCWTIWPPSSDRRVGSGCTSTRLGSADPAVRHDAAASSSDSSAVRPRGSGSPVGNAHAPPRGPARPATSPSESAPRFLCTTRWALPSGASRSSQLASSSCSAALPMRIGGFDTIVPTAGHGVGLDGVQHLDRGTQCAPRCVRRAREPAGSRRRRRPRGSGWRSATVHAIGP